MKTKNLKRKGITQAVKIGGYKDSYASGSFESKSAFLEMKAKRKESKFSITKTIIESLLPKVKTNPVKVNVLKSINGEGIDYRLPAYVLRLIDKNSVYRVTELKRNTIKGTGGLIEFSLVKKG